MTLYVTRHDKLISKHVNDVMNILSYTSAYCTMCNRLQNELLFIKIDQVRLDLLNFKLSSSAIQTIGKQDFLMLIRVASVTIGFTQPSYSLTVMVRLDKQFIQAKEQ